MPKSVAPDYNKLTWLDHYLGSGRT